jgi:transposase
MPEGIKDVRFKRQSMVSTVCLSGEKVAFVFEGTLNKELFVQYLRIWFAPALGPLDVLVLDNSSVHTSKLVREVLGSLELKWPICLFILRILILWSLCGHI